MQNHSSKKGKQLKTVDITLPPKLLAEAREQNLNRDRTNSNLNLRIPIPSKKPKALNFLASVLF